jgi:hypothetical protein
VTIVKDRLPMGQRAPSQSKYASEIGVDRCEGCGCWIAWGPDAFDALREAALPADEDCTCRCHDAWHAFFGGAE